MVPLRLTPRLTKIVQMTAEHTKRTVPIKAVGVWVGQAPQQPQRTYGSFLKTKYMRHLTEPE